MENSNNWCVDCSDDEDKYGANRQWEPSPGDIIRLYQSLANGEDLALDWKCPGRRVPQTGKKSKPGTNNETNDKNLTANSNTMVVSPSGYDFDADEVGGSPVTPSRVRVPGKTPKSAQKRVARFDRVINDINRQKLGSPVGSPDGQSSNPPTYPSTSSPNQFPQQKQMQQQMQQLRLQQQQQLPS